MALIVNPGYHTTYIHCTRCGHVKRVGVVPENAYVGKTHRLRCSICGAREALLSASWSWGQPPTAEVISLAERRSRQR